MIDYITVNVVPVVAQIIEKVGEWITAFQDLPAPIQEAVYAVAAVLGVGGPLLLAIGAVSLAITTLIGAAGPIGLFIVAVGALGTAWALWSEEITAVVGPAFEYLSGKVSGVIDLINGIIGAAQSATQYLAEMFGLAESEAEAALQADIARMDARWDAIRQNERESSQIDSFVRSVGVDTSSYSSIGNDIGAGIAQGVTESGGAEEIRDYLNSIPETARDDLGIQSPSRVFAEIGRFISEGLGLGITEASDAPAAAMAEVVGGIEDQTNDAAVALSGLEQTARSAFAGFVTGSMSASDAVGSLLSKLRDTLIDNAFQSIFGGFFGGGGFLGSLIGANANGTNNWRGGLTMVNERGGEIMNLPRGTQIIPHDVSMEMARNAGGSNGGAVEIVVRSDPGVIVEIARNTAGAMIGQNNAQFARQVPGIVQNRNKRAF
ncbi:MAG: hypothetical protein U5N55_11615 [Cypionkella sp.]|nr:hypothetical protein [Cypionkella sp.]